MLEQSKGSTNARNDSGPFFVLSPQSTVYAPWRLYRSDCQECHGVRGEGDAERFVPVLAGQHYPYLLRQVRAIAGGRRGNASRSMERHARPYSDAELQAVVDFASRLDATRREERH